MEYYRTEKRGRIYAKYYNLVATFKRGVSKYITETKTKKKGEKMSGHESILLAPDEDAENHLRALKFDNLTSEEFDSTWKACWGYRHHCIKTSESTVEILEKWPFYKTPSGYRLIDMDFKSAFNSSDKDGLLEGWNTMSKKLCTFLTSDNHVKDNSVKNLLKRLTEDTTISENGRNAAVIWALHGYLVPTTKIVKKDVTGKKSTMKFTIKDSQESVIFVGGTLIEVEDR